MKKKKIGEFTLQWLLPCFILIFVLAVIIIKFDDKINAAIDNVIDSEIEQTGAYYCKNVNNILGSLADITNTMQSMLEKRGDGNVTFLQESINTIALASDAYMAAYCYTNGNARLNDGQTVDMSSMSYYSSLTGTEPYFIYVRNDQLTDTDAFVYVCPVQYGEEVNGYLLAYLDVDDLGRAFEDSPYGSSAFYSIINGNGTIIGTYGNTADTELLKNDFWNSLKNVAQSLGSWTLFDRKQQKGEFGILLVKDVKEKRILCHFPVEGTDWHLVMGLDESYVAGLQQSFHGPMMELVVKLCISLAVYLAAVLLISVLLRIKATEHSQALENKADTDLLTELNNKMATERKIKEYMEQNPGKQAVMFVLDVDNFKKINDTMGHAFGDEVLRNLGVRLQSMFRTTDIIGRTGGDEFIVFLKDIREVPMIEREGKKIEQFFHQFEVGEYVKYSITASVGGAIFPKDGETFENLYKAADSALYVSKRHGKNQLTFYKQEKNSGVV